MDFDDDDLWFFDSIKRYKNLLMYDLQGTALNACFASDDKIILTCCRTTASEILELSVAQDLITEENSDSIMRSRDFKIISAGYCKGKSTEIVLVNEGIATSETQGIELYKLGNKDSDVISHQSSLRNDLQNPLISFNENETSLVSGNTFQNIQSANLLSGQVKKVAIPRSTDITIAPELSYLRCSNSTMYYGMQKIGKLNKLDTRSETITQCISIQNNNAFPHWTYSSSCDDKLMAIANNSGEIKVFDIRNISKEYFHTSLKSYKLDKEPSNVIINFDSGNQFLSVSGYQRSVFVFSLTGDDNTPTFVHDGHRKQTNYLTFHLWHPTRGKLIFSSDDTNVLQAWRFY